MNPVLGVRLALAGGREAAARMVLMAIGCAVGVTLLLFALAAMPALQGRIDRLAWHRTTDASPATAPDHALWLPVTDRWEGWQVTRVQVAALGPRPPVPPGMPRLPGAGEVFVSPRLAELMRSVPADQLADRFPGRIVGEIGPAGLITPGELVAVVGRAPDHLRGAPGVMEIRGIERPGADIDLATFLRVFILVIAGLLVAPVVVFVAMVTRVGAARREQRFAAIRLAGATRLQTGVLAATETALAGVTGSLLGLAGFLALRPWVVATVTFDADAGLHAGSPFFPSDVTVPTVQFVAALVGLPVIAVLATLVSLHRAQVTPLGVGRRTRRRPPGPRRLLLLAAGIAAVVAAAGSRGTGTDTPLIIGLNLFAPLALILGLVLAGPWACMWASRAVARVSRRIPTLVAARRIAADPYTAFRAVSGVALAVFVATVAGTAATGPVDRGGVGPGVVGVQVRGTPEAALRSLIESGDARDDVVVARAGADGSLVVACADLARVTNLTCPLPAVNRSLDVSGLGPVTGFREPGPGDDDLPVHSIFVPTDGSAAAEERVRTIAATVAPFALARVDDDRGGDADGQLGGIEGGLWLLMAFVLLVAACSLTVALVAGLMERRRPFALLRASGVRLGELRLIALLETAVPLLFTVLGAMGVALLVAYLGDPGFTMPGAGFFGGVAVAVLVALAVCLVTLPLMDRATRLEAVRFE